MNFFVLVIAWIAGSFWAESHQLNTKNISENQDLPRLEVEASMNAKELDISSTFKLTVKIRNVSETPIHVYKEMAWGRGASLSFAIIDSAGRVVKGGMLPDAVDIPPFSVTNFQLLEQNEFLSAERWIDLSSQGLSRRGRYKLAVSYHSPVARENSPADLTIWAAEDGTVSARPVVFKVFHRRQ